jgi:hypothetical protein
MIPPPVGSEEIVVPALKIASYLVGIWSGRQLRRALCQSGPFSETGTITNTRSLSNAGAFTGSWSFSDPRAVTRTWSFRRQCAYLRTISRSSAVTACQPVACSRSIAA